MTDPLTLALSQQGKPYVWATPVSYTGTNPSSFDCSGLAGWAYYQAGIRPTLPHNTIAMHTEAVARGWTVPITNAQPGDIMFLQSAGLIHHCGIVTTPATSTSVTVVEAPTTGIPVRIRTYSIPGSGADSVVSTGLSMTAMGNAPGGFVNSGPVATTSPWPAGHQPPYDPSTLKAPLSAVQRTRVKAWLNWYATNETPGIKYNMTGDQNIINLYSEFVGGSFNQKGGVPSWLSGVDSGVGNAVNDITSPLSFLQDLANPQLWERVGLAVVGLIVVGIGVAAMVSQSKTVSKAPKFLPL